MSTQIAEGDPGKLAYFRNPNWTPAPRENLRDVEPMPGTCMRCVFGRGEHSTACRLSITLQDSTTCAEAD